MEVVISTNVKIEIANYAKALTKYPISRKRAHVKVKVENSKGRIIEVEAFENDEERLLFEQVQPDTIINVKECVANGYMTLEDFDKKVRNGSFK